MGYKRLFIFIFEFVLIIISLSKTHSNGFIRLVNTSYLIFFIICFFSINIFLRPYYVTVVPIVLINIGFILSNVKSSKKIISFLFSIYLLNQFIGNIYIYTINKNNLSFYELKNSFINIPSNALVGGDLVCWFMNPRLDWLVNEDLNPKGKLINSNKNRNIYWFHLPYPSYIKSSLSKERSINSDDADISKRVFNNTIYKNSKLISSFENPNYEEIQLWKLN